jgi:hypothetical protein
MLLTFTLRDVNSLMRVDFYCQSDGYDDNDVSPESKTAKFILNSLDYRNGLG